MTNFKFKLLVKKKFILLPVLILCSIFICEKGFSGWDRTCCLKYYNSKKNRVRIYYKFYENNSKISLKNSFLEDFKFEYSTDNGITYTYLMTTSTDNQTTEDWAWVVLKNKKENEKINIVFCPFKQSRIHTHEWVEKLNVMLKVQNHLTKKDETWLCVDWFPMKALFDVTDIQITGKWREYGIRPAKTSILNYKLRERQCKLNAKTTNSFFSFPQQEIRPEVKNNTVKTFKESNAIVFKGVLNQKIQVFTTTGKLVKSFVADNDLVKIELSVKQAYFVNVGQKTYKMAL